jgi:LmbE family N-acetylglucosaminyl deacetylase
VGLAGAEAAIFSIMPHFKPEGSPHQVNFVAFYATNKPNTFIDITSHFEKKLEAIRQHKSQFPPPVFQVFSAYLDAKSREWSRKKDGEKAEAFKVLSPYHLHINVDAVNC